MSRKSVSLDMTPDEFTDLIQSLDPLELRGLYHSLLHAKTTIGQMIAVTQLEVMERVMSGEADPEIEHDGVTYQ